jgi:hypothetical protein
MEMEMTEISEWPWGGLLAVAALELLAMSLGFFG